MNKQLVITGLAQETDFIDPSRTRSVLVINNGELRVSIDESSVEKVLQYVLNGHNISVDSQPKEAAAAVDEVDDEDDHITYTAGPTEPDLDADEDQDVPDDQVVDQESGIAQL